MASSKPLMVFSRHLKVPQVHNQLLHHLHLQVLYICNLYLIILLIFLLLSKRVNVIVLLILLLNLFSIINLSHFHQFSLSLSSISTPILFQEIVLFYARQKTSDERYKPSSLVKPKIWLLLRRELLLLVVTGYYYQIEAR